jgi:hypothetical protein
VCPKETSSLLYLSMSRKGRWSLGSTSMANWMLGWMLLMWLRTLLSSSGQ